MLIRNPKYFYIGFLTILIYVFKRIKKDEVRGSLDDELLKMIKKSKLTKEELKELFNKTKNIDPKTDHSLAVRTLTNPIRRKILQAINCDIKSEEDIKKECNLDNNQFNFHINMLKQTYYVINSVDGWKLTPRGIGFLENAKLSD